MSKQMIYFLFISFIYSVYSVSFLSHCYSFAPLRLLSQQFQHKCKICEIEI